MILLSGDVNRVLIQVVISRMLPSPLIQELVGILHELEPDDAL